VGLRIPSSLFPPAVSALARPLERLAMRADRPLSRNSPVKLHHLREGMFGDTGRKNSNGTPRFHAGVDLVAAIGTRVYAVAPGRVEWIRWNVSGYGNCLLQSFRWKDGNVFFAFFAHLSHVLTRKHQEVKPGQTTVALTGVSGLPLVRDATGSTSFHPCSTHPHLHFEVRTSAAEHMPDGRHLRLDPQLFLGLIPYQHDTIDYVLYKNSIA
jgi:murein DD-endopeptidase MepM/ murein hydrolase activator NlpD